MFSSSQKTHDKIVKALAVMDNWTGFEVVVENCNKQLSQYQNYDPATNTCHWKPLKVFRALGNSAVGIDLPNGCFHYFSGIKNIRVKNGSVIIETDDGRIYTVTQMF